MSGHYCKRAVGRVYAEGCTFQCGECGAWEALHLKEEYEAKIPYRATLRFNDEVRVIEGNMQTDPEPHEGHRACQKRFAGDAHTIANMGGMMNEADTLLYDFMFNLTDETWERLHERALEWQKRWEMMREARLPKSQRWP